MPLPCTRYYPLSNEEAPHRVILNAAPFPLHKPLSMPALREQREWLESETHGATGRFHDGGHTWNCPDRGKMVAFLYRFTDETTAFYFKMRFG